MSVSHFGEIPGVSVGAAFADRRALAVAGVHRPPMAGICGTTRRGAESIVVNGGYVDDKDFGGEILYTGAGGNDTATKGKLRISRSTTRQTLLWSRARHWASLFG